MITVKDILTKPEFIHMSKGLKDELAKHPLENIVLLDEESGQLSTIPPTPENLAVIERQDASRDSWVTTYQP